MSDVGCTFPHINLNYPTIKTLSCSFLACILTLKLSQNVSVVFLICILTLRTAQSSPRPGSTPPTTTQMIPATLMPKMRSCFQKHSKNITITHKSQKKSTLAQKVFRGELLCFYLSAWWWREASYFSQRISNFVVKMFLGIIIIIITRCVIMVSKDIFSLSENSFRNIYNDLLCCDII